MKEQLQNRPYYDTCPECDGMNVRITDEMDDGMIRLYCYECGAEWDDYDTV